MVTVFVGVRLFGKVSVTDPVFPDPWCHSLSQVVPSFVVMRTLGLVWDPGRKPMGSWRDWESPSLPVQMTQHTPNLIISSGLVLFFSTLALPPSLVSKPPPLIIGIASFLSLIWSNSLVLHFFQIWGPALPFKRMKFSSKNKNWELNSTDLTFVND